jgi:hypothetical protein
MGVTWFEINPFPECVNDEKNGQHVPVDTVTDGNMGNNAGYGSYGRWEDGGEMDVCIG